MAFESVDGVLHAESVSCEDIAQQYGTPCFVYSRSAIERAFDQYREALEGCKHLICYAVKANSNLAVLDLLGRRGAGFDIVSVGELERVIAAGGDPAKIVFSGVVKQAGEMRRALELGICCFNIESAAELEVLQEVAQEMDQIAPISVRVNPNVDAKTHPYISTGLRENKFGVPTAEALQLLRRAQSLANLEVVGLDCHIGSQLTEMEPLLEALGELLSMIDTLAEEGIAIRHLDLGGGIGVRYKDEQPPTIDAYINAVRAAIGERDLTLVFEPGRSIVANAGVLLTQVHYLKETEANNFALVDAAMNDFIRPALYQAWVDIEVVSERESEGDNAQKDGLEWSVVGPVCETADFLGKDRALDIAPGSLLAVRGAGAYGFTMSSNYNTRPRAAEVLVDGSNIHLVRERETIEDLLRGEHRLPDQE